MTLHYLFRDDFIYKLLDALAVRAQRVMFVDLDDQGNRLKQILVKRNTVIIQLGTCLFLPVGLVKCLFGYLRIDQLL
jgi:hypothetical protein